MRIFQKKRINPNGLILPLDEFRMFLDEPDASFCPEKMSKVLALAEKALKTEIKTMPLWNYRQYLESGSVDLYGSLYMDRLRYMFQLGLAEAYEGKGRFTEKLIDYIWAILEMASWVLPEHTVHLPEKGPTKVPPVCGDRYLHGLELGAIYLAADLAWIYTLNKAAIDGVSPLIGERIVYELKNRILRPYINCDFGWEGDRGNRVNNWCPWNICGILIVCALIEDDMISRERIVEKALRHLDNFVGGYAEDGGCDEGPSYWGAAGGSMFECLELLYDMSGGKIDVYSEPIIRAIGEYPAKMNISGVHFVNFADSHARGSHDGRLLYRYGKKCGSEVLMAFGDVMSAYNDCPVDFKHPYRTVRTLMSAPINKEGIVARAAKSCYLPDLKVMVERASENPKEGLFLAIKGGNNGEFHNHNDVGSFIVYYDGEPVLIDVGVGGYTRQTFSPQRYELWFMQSRYHNLPMFDGEGEKEGGAYRSEDERYDPDERSMTMQLRSAFMPHVGVTSFIRKARFDTDRISICDTVELDRERLCDFVFMTHREPSVISPGVISLPMGRQLLFDAEALAAEIEEFDPVGLDSNQAWGTPKLWRIHLKATTDNASFTFEII